MNIFGVAYLNTNSNPFTQWFVQYNQFKLKIAQKFIQQRNLTLTYNIIGYQL